MTGAVPTVGWPIGCSSALLLSSCPVTHPIKCLSTPWSWSAFVDRHGLEHAFLASPPPQGAGRRSGWGTDKSELLEAAEVQLRESH